MAACGDCGGPMDARLVWDTWRRILLDDGLVENVTHASRTEAATVAGLGAAELAVVADYARTPRATQTNIGMYRRGLVRIALSALSRVPLSQRLLFTSGLDADAAAAEFTRANGYADDGPNFWRLAGAFVAYLATRAELAAPVQQDVLALDRALVALARRLGETEVERWPDAAAHEARVAARSDCSSTRFVASHAAIVVASRHDLTPWIENPRGYDPKDELPASPRWWLIYFPDAESAPEYAELSERSARIFELLATPKTAGHVAQALGAVSGAEVLRVIDKLSALGVVVTDRKTSRQLPNDAFVMLDPAVELLDVEVAEHRLLCHHYFEIGMAVPPGEGLSSFVGALTGKPIQVGRLRRGFDDQRLIDTMLDALRQHGFLHLTSQALPSSDELARLRDAAEEHRRPSVRRTLSLDLEETSADDVRARVESEAAAPELELCCARITEHAETLAELASLRQTGRLRLHHATVRTADVTGCGAVVRSLRHLGAEVILDGVEWPAPEHPIADLDTLTRAGVPVHALTTPDRSLLDPAVRACSLAWAEAMFLTGLCLKLEPDALWPAAEPTEDELVAVFKAVGALEDALGDIRIVNLPSDEVLLGNTTSSSSPAERSRTTDRFRAAYRRWRLPLLKSIEGDNTFSQTPDAEEKLVRLQEDLLPNHPELLGLRPGSVVVDVCGGNGRVARRLSPLVGDEGVVISIEMLRCVTDRARHFAGDRGFTNLQFRTGLAQRIPLPDAAADAAVNEWTGAIWQLGLGPEMVAEMARVVRPGGRIAVTHRLVRLPLVRLGEPWVQFADIYTLMRSAFARSELTIVAERVWGQTVSTLVGETAAAWRKHYLPRIVNPFDVTYTDDDDPGPRADVCLTMIAERR